MANARQLLNNYTVKKETDICSVALNQRKVSLFFCLPVTGVDLLALYNHPPVREGQVKYYTVKVPLRVQNCDEGVKGVEANWLDHMTQHFNNGASLVDGYFHLGNVNGKTPRIMNI